MIESFEAFASFDQTKKDIMTRHKFHEVEDVRAAGVHRFAARLLVAGIIFASWLAHASSGVGAEPVMLAADGEPRAAIVLPAEPDAQEQTAAEELVQHIRLISGAELPVLAVGDNFDGLLPVYLGAAADAALDAPVRAAKDSPSSFALRVTPGRIDIRGLSAEGTLFGVCELLEQLGVRWYHPGELGRVLPVNLSPALQRQETVQAPSMDYRRLQHIGFGEWRHRVRLGGRGRSTGSHGLPGEQRGTGSQACVSGHHNSGTLENIIAHIRRREPSDDFFTIGMGPRDGGAYSYCECAGCTALDRGVHDPFWNVESMTDRYIWLFNQVLEATAEDYPNLHIVWYVYQRHMMPPVIQPNPRIVPVFAPINLERIRAMDNPMSPDRHILRWLIDEWHKTNPNEMYYRGYYNNLACPQFPFSQIDRVRNEIPSIHQKGINVMRVEVIDGGPSWSANTPTLYLATRLMWNVDADVDALLNEFYTLYYGPARDPMQRYHETLEAAFRDTPYMTGSSYLYFPIFLHHPRRDALREALNEAAAVLPDSESVYAARLRTVRLAWDRLEHFLDMIDARNRFDFEAAHGLIEPFDRISDELVGYVLEGHDERARSRMRMLTWRSRSGNSRSMFNRFFSQPIRSGYARTVEIGDFVAGFPDEWQFLLDPAGIGDIGGWHRPGELGGNWQPIKTFSRSWSDQGLHYYKGVAWYRQKITIPAEFEGRPLYLWFGGKDGDADIWINGHFMGSNERSPEGLPGVPGSFRPFDIPTVDADGNSVLAFGGENWVTVKIANLTLAELGTGGLLAPGMFWSPHDPDWQP